MKHIKLKIRQDLLKELLDSACEDCECEVLVRFILTNMRKSLNNVFFIKQEFLQIQLKPFEALALWRYIQYKQVDNAFLEAFEMIEFLLKNGIVKQKEMLTTP
ncbi:MAG: hypothetical protein ACRCR9_00125 [Chitinophagaceae bacterium]